jgi:hypothetical protein
VYDHERQLRVLAALYEEGQIKYRTIVSPEKYTSMMDEWAARVTDILTKSFSVSDVFKFDDARRNQGFWLTIQGADAEWDEATKLQRMSISGRLQALRDIIEFGVTPMSDYAALGTTIDEGGNIVARY